MGTKNRNSMRWGGVLYRNRASLCKRSVGFIHFDFNTIIMFTTVRSGAEEHTFSGARLHILVSRLRSYHVNHVHCRW